MNLIKKWNAMKKIKTISQDILNALINRINNKIKDA